MEASAQGHAEPRAAAPLAASLYLCSFASGTAALAYQVAWTKLLSLAFGSTTLAASAVVAAFMGGMGVGAWVYHYALSRVTSPLRLYAWIEFGIAGTALLLTLLLPTLPAAMAALAPWLTNDSVLVAGRFLAVFVLLLAPAALMGATFPALCVALIRSAPEVGRHLGMLYGLNTVGAAVGALVAGLAGVELLGLRGTVLAGNAINVAVGVFALVLVRRGAAVGSGSAAPDASTSPGDVRPMQLPTRLPNAVSGAVLLVSGFATLGYEILWFRALSYLFGNSTYAFTLMLVTFLTGLGLGGACLGIVSRRPRPELDLARCQLGIGVLSVVAIGCVTLLVGNESASQYLSIFVARVFDLPWWQRMLVHSLASILLLLPATLLMGLSFPLASSLFLGDVRRLGERVGGAVLLSNLGSIAGAITAALVILPSLGTVGGTRALAVVNLCLGVLVLSRIPAVGRGGIAWAGGAIAALVAACIAFPSAVSFVGSADATREVELVFAEEGDLSTVQVWHETGHPERMAMTLDGTPIGVTPGWNPGIYAKQLLLAHLPRVLDTRLRKTLNVGLGSASTVEALASHPEVERLDVVEISEAVLRAASRFEESAVLDDPRVDVAIDDALYYLLTTPVLYDLIISDGKQAAHHSGNAKLLSREFYDLARARLAPDGLLVQWISLSIGAEEWEIILRTFTEAFPEVEVFYDPPASAFIVGSRTPIAGRPRMSEAAFESGRIREDMARVHVGSVAGLLAHWVASGPQLVAELGPGPVNTWNQPLLEFTAYRQRLSVFQRMPTRNLDLLVRAEAAGDSASGRELAPPDSAPVRAWRKLRRAQLTAGVGDLVGALSLARQAQRIAPQVPAAAYWVAQFESRVAARRGAARRP